MLGGCFFPAVWSRPLQQISACAWTIATSETTYFHTRQWPICVFQTHRLAEGVHVAWRCGGLLGVRRDSLAAAPVRLACRHGTHGYRLANPAAVARDAELGE